MEAMHMAIVKRFKLPAHILLDGGVGYDFRSQDGKEVRSVIGDCWTPLENAETKAEHGGSAEYAAIEAVKARAYRVRSEEKRTVGEWQVHLKERVAGGYPSASREVGSG